MNEQNVVGAQIRKARFKHELTQDLLAARCGALGWDISRGTLAKIEAQLRRVTDRELWYLARALRVEIATLYPKKVSAPQSVAR